LKLKVQSVIENVDEFVYCLRIIDEYYGVRPDDISRLNRYKFVNGSLHNA
jgi:hypothetical protein